MELRGSLCELRPWRWGDERALVHHANNVKIWRHLTNDFPHPYTDADARAWIARAQETKDVPTTFAVVVDGGPVGGAGFERREDVDRRLTASIGYWLGEAYWGRGIATDALVCVTAYAFEGFDFERLETTVFEGNPASCRVLEKAGYSPEGRLRRSIVKASRVLDSLIYAKLRE